MKLYKKWAYEYQPSRYAPWELELLTIDEPPIFRELILRHGIYPYA